MKRSYHFKVSVRSVLHQDDRELLAQWSGCLTGDDGRSLTTPDEIREAFMDELVKGREFIPAGDCDNFDYKSGCMGHDA